MAPRSAGARYLLVLAFALLGRTSYAQSAIAGVVKDATGAVLPGVAVEASSPALIEKVRTVSTNSEGQYNIVDLRPGVYTVTFTLSGFATVRREGLELPAGFTATANAELRVGSVEETVTVSGQTPTVDIRNVTATAVLSKSVLESLPNADRLLTYASITPGAFVPPTQLDVGGAAGDPNGGFAIHGSKAGDARRLVDGMTWNSMEGNGGASGHAGEAQSIDEVVLVLGGASAEHEVGGVVINIIPKYGSNTFHGGFFGSYGNHALQSNNLTEELQAQGLRSVNSVKLLYDNDGSFGGPVLKDKLWFFLSARSWGSQTYVPNQYYALYHKEPEDWIYTPDYNRPAIQQTWNYQGTLRFSWQATSKQKFNFAVEPNDQCFCNQSISATLTPEAAWTWQYAPDNVFHTSWSYAKSNRLLIEAGALAFIYHFDAHVSKPVDGGATAPGIETISVFDSATGLRYRGALPGSGFWGNHTTNQANQRFAVSYITGSHAFKTGVTLIEGWRLNPQTVAQSVDYTFFNGTPLSLTQYAMPFVERERLKADLGVYFQDQWTIRRLTLNYGVRLNFFNAFVPVQDMPAGRFVSARSFAAVDCVPCWNDVFPRLGANYDLAGDGKTAIKGYFGTYAVGGAGLGPNTITSQANPAVTAVNNATRTWTDGNRNYVPDCDFSNSDATGECGRLSNLNFGLPNPNATRYASDVLTGWRVRPYSWQANISLDREVWSRTRVSVGYYRAWYGNFTVTQNQATTPSDFDPYCITAPADPRLPGGGGNQICGLYDVTPTKFGRFSNVVTQAAHFGKQSEVSQYIDATISTRFPRGQFAGGISTGTTRTNSCFVVNSPQDLSYNTFGSVTPGTLASCDIEQPWIGQTQVKLSGFYGLPWDLQVSGTFQNLAGPAITATYVATNAQIAPSLGRNLAAGPAATVSIPLIAPNTEFGSRITQLDVRLTKALQIKNVKTSLSLDMYNALNGSPVTGYTTQYGQTGAGWLRPTGVLVGRIIKFVYQMNF